MSKHGGAYTVGSLRGVPQAARPAPTHPNTPPPTIMQTLSAMPRRRCCRGGCGDCPVGRQIRASMGLPLANEG
jgi:hypothetical protein